MRRLLLAPSFALALFLLALPAAADCPLDPSDVAPGVLEPGMVPTWRAAGDAQVTVRDLIVLRNAVEGSLVIQWSTPVTAGCPEVPADLAPGYSFGAALPPHWNISGDADVTEADRNVALDRALGRIQFLPGAGLPLAPGERSLAGQVLSSRTGSGLPGVGVTVTGPGHASAAATNASGEFFVTGLPLGTFHVILDGSTASDGEMPPGVYPTLAMMATITAPGTTDMPVTTLPDLSNPDAANAMVPLDGNGKATMSFATNVAGAMGPVDLGVSGPSGSKFTSGGAPLLAPVMLNVTPVPGDEVPMPLPSTGGKLNPSSFVTIQPPNVVFDTTEAGALVAPGSGDVSGVVLPCGLSTVLPNLNGLPIGTMVDVWSFDHGVEDWVNRSEQTGQQGVVVDLGSGMTAVSADCVILEGGWHAPVIPIDDDCATRLVGRVVDALGAPLAGVFIATTLGSFGQTGADGTFSIDSVPAYTGATAPGCAAVGFTLTLTSPLGSAHETLDLPVDVMAVQRGSDTLLGDLVLPVGLTGCVGGRVTDNGVPGEGVLLLEGPPGAPSLMVPLDAGGSFFVNGFEPGGWTASFTFSNEELPRVVPFLVPAGRCTALNIGRSAGSGQRDIEVFVVLDDDNEPGRGNPPVPGALVQLFGTDSGSEGGLLGVTGQDGVARFQGVEGPFFVTAQADITAPMTGARLRLTTTLPQIDPAGSSIGVMLLFEEDFQPTQTNATVSGTVMNIPNLDGDFLQVTAEDRGRDSSFRTFDFPSPTYQLDVLSGRPFDLKIERLRYEDQGSSPFLRSALLALGIAVAPGQNRILDFDFSSPNVVPFNLATPFAITSGHFGTVEQQVELNGRGPGGEQVRFEPFNLPQVGGLVEPGDPAGLHLGPWPDTLDLPNLGHPGLAGMDFTLRLQEHYADFDHEHELTCELFLGKSTPGSVTRTLPSPPMLVSPGPFETLTVDSANNMTPTLALPMGDSGLGINLFFIGSEDGAPEGLDGAGWVVFLPATGTSATLRPPPRPVFADTAFYAIEASTIRVPMTVDYDALFTGELNESLRSLLVDIDNCEAHTLQLFGVSDGE